MSQSERSIRTRAEVHFQAQISYSATKAAGLNQGVCHLK